MTDYLIPLLLLAASLLALRRKENTYDLLLQGGAEGLRLLLTITPALVILLTAVHMLRASGAVEILSTFLAPLFHLVGIPPGNCHAGADPSHQRQCSPGRRSRTDGPIRR